MTKSGCGILKKGNPRILRDDCEQKDTKDILNAFKSLRIFLKPRIMVLRHPKCLIEHWHQDPQRLFS